jgi:hypothetical protein
VAALRPQKGKIPTWSDSLESPDSASVLPGAAHPIPHSQDAGGWRGQDDGDTQTPSNWYQYWYCYQHQILVNGTSTGTSTSTSTSRNLLVLVLFLMIMRHLLQVWAQTFSSRSDISHVGQGAQPPLELSDELAAHQSKTCWL